MNNNIYLNNRYLIRDPQANVLGQGGMGIVYRGEDTETGQPVAVKQLLPGFVAHNAEIVSRFIREGEALRQLNHPNIVQLLDVIEKDDQHYLIMEFAVGGSLQDLLTAEQQLPIPQILNITLELADALTRAHHLNIIHRDLKPANVLLAANGTPRLTDFGAAHVETAPRITQSNVLIGSPGYLSPEMLSQKTIDARADIWAFGILLYEMVTGTLPFSGNSLPEIFNAILKQELSDILSKRPDCDPHLAALIRSMLVRDRAKRLSTMRQVAVQLEAIQRGRPLSIPILSTTDDPQASVGSPLQIYHQETVDMLSTTRYQMDNRFVNLTLLLDRGVEAQGVRFVVDEKRNQFDSLSNLLGDVEEEVLVLLGQPGSGKTTLLRHLQFELVRTELNEHNGKTVFFVPLNGYRPWGTKTPFEWLADKWQKSQPDLPSFRKLFREGRFHLLLDGLNEIPHRDKAHYREKIDQWRQFLRDTTQYGNRVLFSCRSLDYSAPLSSMDVPVRQVRVEQLSQAQMETFLQAYLPEIGTQVWTQLQQNPAQLSLFSNPFFLRLLVAQVGDQAELPSGQAALLTGFVRRTLHREVSEQTHYLFQPDTLLSDGDYEQILHHAWQTPYELPWEGELFTQLGQLAYAMQVGRDSDDAGQVRILEREALKLLDHPQARNIVQAGIQLNILDKEVATRELFFSHQLIQEYFAARVLAQSPVPTKVAVPWRADEMVPSLADTIAGLDVSEPLPASPTTGWEETTILAVAMTTNQEQFVRNLMPVNLPLAARCAAASEVQLPESLVTEIQQTLIGRIEEPLTDLRARIATANSLSTLGDPRFEHDNGPYGPYLRSPMIRIPGGTYPMGRDDHSSIEDKIFVRQTEFEKPAHTIKVTPFEIGIFPVTNAEYQLFLEGGGYEDERWWLTKVSRSWLQRTGDLKATMKMMRDLRDYWQSMAEEQIKNRSELPESIEYYLKWRNASEEEFEAWCIEAYEYETKEAFRQPQYWDESRFNQPTQPVVGITWFEALAYCTWLSAQSGERFDLPTEAEWEAAARGLQGRIYSYGNVVKPAQCNVFETHIRSTTPVSIFPEGRTPEGMFDLNGNVWEWTTTLWGDKFTRPDYLYPYVAEDGREDREKSGKCRVVRGGSWEIGLEVANTTYRERRFQSFRKASDHGFRVVRRPAPCTQI